MKNDGYHTGLTKRYRGMLFISLIICALLIPGKMVIARESTDTVAKLPLTMNLSSILSNGNRTVKVLVSRKENNKTIRVDDLKTPIHLYLNEVKEYDPATGAGRISQFHLNEEGEGIMELPAWFKKLADSIHEYTFIINMKDDPLYEDVEEQITIADARISLEYSGEDSVKTVSAILSGWKDQAYTPLPSAELKLCIKRTFNFLPFGEAEQTTNEAGELSGELPLDLPGNSNGTLTIAARLEEDDVYGTVEVTKDVPWTVMPKLNPVRGRTLWSPGDNAPLLLVISSITIIVVIWGTIIYLVYLLFKIKRLSKAP